MEDPGQRKRWVWGSLIPTSDKIQSAPRSLVGLLIGYVFGRSRRSRIWGTRHCGSVIIPPSAANPEEA